MKNNRIKTTRCSIFFLLIFGSVACKKEIKDGDPVKLKVEGNIKETQTSLPLNKVAVQVFQYVSGSIGSANFECTGQTLTDVSGNYNIEANTEYGEFLILSITDKNHRSVRNYECHVKNDYLRYDVNLDIPGYVKVILRSKFPADSAIISYRVESNPFTNHAIGKLIYDDYVFATSALKGIKVYYTVYRNKLLTKYIDSVDVPLRDTAVFQTDF